MKALAWIGEQRIAQAAERGEFDHLPGAGHALDLHEQDAALPLEVRQFLRWAERRRADDAATRRFERERLRLLWRRALLDAATAAHDRAAPAAAS
jgi:hypothetical protein